MRQSICRPLDVKFQTALSNVDRASALQAVRVHDTTAIEGKE
jgi:hypothetical protein